LNSPVIRRLLKFIGTLLFIALVIAGIRAVLVNRFRAETASEFVEKYSAAYRAKDVNTVIRMTADPKILDMAGVDESLRKQIKAYNLSEARANLKEQFKSEDMFYSAWCETKFEKAVEHSDHIHVTVSIGAARSEIVLVREDGYLKIHPFPSVFGYE
jgi:hypothetical protein